MVTKTSIKRIEMGKLKSFFFHYNKPLSKKHKKPIISIHYQKQCLYVENVVCSVPTRGKIRNKQPYFVMCGKATNILVKEKIAYII